MSGPGVRRIGLQAPAAYNGEPGARPTGRPHKGIDGAKLQVGPTILLISGIVGIFFGII